MEANEANFFARIMSHFNQVSEYEEPRLQDLYLARIPVVELHTRAEAIRLEKLRTNEKMSSKDCLVLALLVWFKCMSSNYFLNNKNPLVAYNVNIFQLSFFMSSHVL